MANFNPDDVEPLGYDFRKFGGQEAVIPEPTDDKILKFWQDTIEMLELGNTDRDTIPKLLSAGLPEGIEPNTDAAKVWLMERDEKVRDLVSGIGQRGTKQLDRRREIIAEVCSNQPSVDELKMLTYRVFNAFEAYVMGNLSPEGLTTALNF